MIVISGASGLIGQAVSVLARRVYSTEFSSGKIHFLVSDSASAYERSGQQRLTLQEIPYVVTNLVTGIGLDKLLRSPRLVFHLAANTHTDEVDHRVNDVGTQTLVDALQPLGPDCHFIFASSVAVSDNRSEPWIPLSEDTPDSDGQANPYTRSKIRTERWLRESARNLGFRLTIIRFVTVYGKYPRPNSIFDLMQTMVVNGSLAARLNWPGRTSVVHAEDAAAAMIRVADCPPKPGATQIFIVHSEALTLAEISKTLHRALDVPYRQIRLPIWVWGVVAAVLRQKRAFEPWLPLWLYNIIWRASMLVDNLFWCETNRLALTISDWQPRKLADSIRDVLVRDTSAPAE